MHDILPYDRGAAVRYAHRWAYDRNPAYYDFSELGGDCTNFASQCLYAGSGVMDHTPTFGWYYISGNQKSPSWSGVPYFYNFLTRKDSRPGPFGTEAGLGELEPGDFIQLSFAGGVFAHDPIVVEIRQPAFPDTILVAAHSQDADFRPLSTYPYQAPAGHPYSGGPPQISDRPPNWFWEVYRFNALWGGHFHQRCFSAGHPPEMRRYTEIPSVRRSATVQRRRHSPGTQP